MVVVVEEEVMMEGVQLQRTNTMTYTPVDSHSGC